MVLKTTKGLLAAISFGLLACQPAHNTSGLTPSAASINRLSQTAIARYYPTTPGLQWHYALTQSQDGQDNTRFHTMHITQEALPESSRSNTPLSSVILRRRYPDASTQPRPGLARRFADRVLLSHYQEGAEALNVSSFRALPFPEAAMNSALFKPQSTGFITALQAPLTPGQQWSGRSFQGGTETLSVKGFENLNTPAGNFETLCIEHHLRYDNGHEDFLRYWYAPEVGMVKMYEEITFYTDHWAKFQSTGVLTHFQRP